MEVGKRGRPYLTVGGDENPFIEVELDSGRLPDGVAVDVGSNMDPDEGAKFLRDFVEFLGAMGTLLAPGPP